MTATATVLSTGDEQLRRFVVRIDLPDGATGTGVLVAPGWVLTCAHVVEGCDVVRVVPDRGAAPEGTHAAVPPWVDARVRECSDAPDVSAASAFWPFPDLALLELDGWTHHVCAPLTKDKPVRASEPHAWGLAAGRRGSLRWGPPGRWMLMPFEDAGLLTTRGDALLAWALTEDSDQPDGT